ncbi:MAG: prepilin peptidase [Candidatus Sericytochromatia bacterium]
MGLSVFVTGGLLGSFLNVVIYRLPREKSIAYPGSKCPKCNNAIAWYDNIPVLSWLALGAKCRYCKEPISFRYPSIELLTAILFLTTFMHFGVGWQWLFLSYFVALMVVITWIDIDHMIILDSVVYPGIILGILYNFINGVIMDSLLASFTGYAIFYALAKGSKLLLKKEGMGEGDITLVALLGAWLGMSKMFGTVFLSFFIGSIIGLFLLIRNRKSEHFPFGPALTASAFITIFSNNYVFDLYMRNFM